MKIIKTYNNGYSFTIQFSIDEVDSKRLGGEFPVGNYDIDCDLEIAGNVEDELHEDLLSSADLDSLVFLCDVDLSLDGDEIYIGSCPSEDIEDEDSDIYLNFRRSDPFDMETEKEIVNNYDRDEFMRLLYLALFDFL